jgi:hypothetical protein
MNTAILASARQLWPLLAALGVLVVLVLSALVIVLRPTLLMLFDALVRESKSWDELSEQLAERDVLLALAYDQAERQQRIERLSVSARDPDDWGFAEWVG